jgi:hypothetical protein
LTTGEFRDWIDTMSVGKKLEPVKQSVKRGKEHMSHVNIPTAFMMNDEKKIINSFPFFGGTTPTPTTTDPEKTTGTPAGGTGEQEDPIAKLQSDPTALKNLLEQVSKTSADLATLTQERDSLASEKEKQTRAQLSKEENLTKDLENATLQIEKLTNVVQNVAIANAFIEKSGDIKWNSVKQAMAELQDGNYSVNIDIDNGVAEVEGIENEVKRIAKDFSWLVKSAGVPEVQDGGKVAPVGRAGRPGQPAATGLPPAPPKGNQGKQARRDGMMNRFPVLMQGR